MKSKLQFIDALESSRKLVQELVRCASSPLRSIQSISLTEMISRVDISGSTGFVPSSDYV